MPWGAHLADLIRWGDRPAQLFAERFDPKAARDSDWKSLMSLDPVVQREIRCGLCDGSKAAGRESPALAAAIDALDASSEEYARDCARVRASFYLEHRRGHDLARGLSQSEVRKRHKGRIRALLHRLVVEGKLAAPLRKGPPTKRRAEGAPPAPARKRTSELDPEVKGRVRERRNQAKKARRQALQFLTSKLIDVAAAGSKFPSLEAEASYLAQEVLARPIKEADLDQLVGVSPCPSTMEEVVGLAARTESEQELEIHRARLRKSLAARGGEGAAAALGRLCAAGRARPPNGRGTGGERAIAL